MRFVTVFLVALVTGLTSVAQAGNPVWAENKTEQAWDITVYRSESCGCCKAWIEHLEEHNFNVDDQVVDNMTDHKQRLGVPQQAASCHTAVVNGKVIEGHVPAQDIKRLLSSDSAIRLLTVPGMPSGGPGMDMPGARKDSFAVYSVDEQNRVDVFNAYQDY